MMMTHPNPLIRALMAGAVDDLRRQAVQPVQPRRDDALAILNAQLADALSANAELANEVKDLQNRIADANRSLQAMARLTQSQAEQIMDLEDEVDGLIKELEGIDDADDGACGDGCGCNDAAVEAQPAGDFLSMVDGGDQVPAAERPQIARIVQEMAERLGVDASQIRVARVG